MTTRTATCSCGQLTLITAEEPIRDSICHSLACQRRTGSPFGAQARFRRAGVRIAGLSHAFVRLGDGGGRITFHFCPTCGSAVHCAIGGSEDSIAVPVGAFADPDFPSSTVSVHEERKHAWVQVPDPVEHLV
jgi:hypothetical protein